MLERERNPGMIHITRNARKRNPGSRNGTFDPVFCDYDTVPCGSTLCETYEWRLER
jgi:hypothetical protein